MKKVIFSLPAEALGEATIALLLGDFNNWDPQKAIQLKAQKNGLLTATVALEAGKSYQYRFLLDNGQWVNDWAAEQYVFDPVFGVENSLITVKGPAAKTPVKRATVKKAKAPAKKVAPAALTEDLTRIEGIGPKIAKLLQAAGIGNFKELGKASGKKLKSILDAAGPKFQMHDPASWPKQAKLAAAEKWEELQALQQTLSGGK